MVAIMPVIMVVEITLVEIMVILYTEQKPG